MTQDVWTAVDSYLAEKMIGTDEVLDAAVKASEDAGLPSIQVSPMQGKLLYLLAKTQRARRILEIGTLGGYSTIWLARALPRDGRLITIEIDQNHSEVAKKNLRRAGLSDKVQVLTGDALDLLPQLESINNQPFDLSFIDADKASIPFYFESALRMSRPGSLILVDNVVRDGEVINADSDDPSIRGVRRLNDILQAERRVTATVLQTVGVKGYDGLAIALVN